VLQAAFLDCQLLDFFPFPDESFVAPKTDVGRCDVVQALVITQMSALITCLSAMQASPVGQRFALTVGKWAAITLTISLFLPSLR